MGKYIQSSLLGCQEPNPPLSGNESRGSPFSEQTLGKSMVQTFEEESLCLELQESGCKVRKESILPIQTGRKGQADNSGREGSGEHVGAWGPGRQGKVLKGMDKQFFSTSSHFLCIPKFLLFLSFYPLWKALWGKSKDK